MAPSLFNRKDSGAVSASTVGLLLPAVLVAAGGGFALQRVVADDSAVGVELPANRYAAPVYDCPEQPRVSDVHNGDRVFAVGVHEEADGWLLIRNPIDPHEQWWIEERYVTADASTTDLPKVGCDDPVPEPEPDELAVAESSTTASTEPTTSSTDPDSPNDTAGQEPPPPPPPSSSETSPTVTGQITPPPPPVTEVPPPERDVTGPTINDHGSEFSEIRESSGEFCSRPELDTATQVWANVSDPAGIASATLFWTAGSDSGQKAMNDTGEVWTAILGPFQNATNSQLVDIEWSVRAVDKAGNERTVAAPTPIKLHGC